MTETAIALAPQRSLVTKFASRYGVEPTKLLDTLKATAFKQPSNGAAITNEQMMALLIVADQYTLNPFTKEIYAFPAKGGGIVPVVSIDGWVRIMNEHPQFDGVEFDWPGDDGAACTCIIYRKDRAHAVRITEYLAECRRNTEPWGSHPRRMLRHKALIQSARVAFGFAGIYDPDEGRRIEQGGTIDADTGEIIEDNRTTGLQAVRAEVAAKRARKDESAEQKAASAAAEPERGDAAETKVETRTKRKAPAAPPADPASAPAPAAATPAPPAQAEAQKGADDPSAGAPEGIARTDLIRRIAWIERAKSKDDALVVVDEVRDEASEQQVADMMAIVNRKWPQ